MSEQEMNEQQQGRVVLEFEPYVSVGRVLSTLSVRGCGDYHAPGPNSKKHVFIGKPGRHLTIEAELVKDARCGLHWPGMGACCTQGHVSAHDERVINFAPGPPGGDVPYSPTPPQTTQDVQELAAGGGFTRMPSPKEILRGKEEE